MRVANAECGLGWNCERGAKDSLSSSLQVFHIIDFETHMIR